MPTPISHLAVGFALSAWAQSAPPSRRVCVVAAACAALPDIDVVGSAFRIGHASLLEHRAITHSLVFAIVSAVVATAVFFHGREWAARRVHVGVILGLALLSHSCLDGLSTYSLGVEFLAPFSQQRFRFAWTPLGSPSWSLEGELIQEALVVLLPALLIGWLGLRRRGRRRSSSSVSASSPSRSARNLGAS